MISHLSVSTIVSGLQVIGYTAHSNLCLCTFFLILGESAISPEDQLLDDMRQVTKDVRSDWYSLAIELEIDYGTRKVRLVCLVV